MAKKFEDDRDKLYVDPFLGFREEIIKERGEDAKPRAFRKKSRKQSRAQGEAIKLSTLKWFQLVEPNIFYVRDSNVLSTANFRGTDIFDIKAKGRQSLTNPHMELAMMRKDRLRVFFQHRRGYDEQMNVTLPLKDFELILDSIALLYAEVKVLNGEDVSSLTKENIYQEGVRKALKSLLLSRNKEDGALDGLMLKRLIKPKTEALVPHSPYEWADGMYYRVPDDFENDAHKRAYHLSSNIIREKDWLWMRRSGYYSPHINKVSATDSAMELLHYRSVLRGDKEQPDYIKQSLLARQGEYYYMWSRNNEQTSFIWNIICDIAGLKTSKAMRFIMYFRPTPITIDLSKFALEHEDKIKRKGYMHFQDYQNVREQLKKLEALKVIKLKWIDGTTYKISFSYFSKQTRQW